MSNKPRRKSKKPVLVKDHSGHTPKPVPSSDWEQLATNPTLAGAFQEFSVRMQRAQAEAMQLSARKGIDVSDLIDYRQALVVLDQHPELVPYIRELQHSERREMLRDSMIIKESPTQSYPQARGNMQGWSTSKDAPQGVPNSYILRNYADNDEWLRAGINKRRDQVGRAEIAVIPRDPKRKFDKKIQYSLELILDQPNERRENWPEQASGVIEDLIVLGRGVWSKNMTVDRKPLAMYAEDAATIKIYPGWGGDPNQPRYLYEEPATSRKVPLRNDEIIMPFYSPATYRYSLSIVQVLMDTIKADIEATRQALRTMQQKPPPHAIQIPGASQSQLEAMRDAYDRNIAGIKEMFWFGGPTAATHFPLIFSAKDNQFLEYQLYLVRKICALLQMSPQSLGVTFDINKATGEVQQEIDETTGLIPLLLLLEDYLNREFVGDFAPVLPYGRYDLKSLNLCVVFPMISEQARQLHAKESLSMASQGLAGLPAMTLNQVLEARGEQNVLGGNTFYIATAMGAVPWLSYDGETGDLAPISTGGALGSQDPAGGPDSDEDDPAAPNASDDDPGLGDDGGAPSADSGNGSDGGSGDAAKSLWYDARPPGMPWKPKYMQRSSLSVARKGSDKPVIPKDEVKANKALRKEAARIFEEAAKRGKKG
jgi:hypothetical protein